MGANNQRSRAVNLFTKPSRPLLKPVFFVGFLSRSPKIFIVPGQMVLTAAQAKNVGQITQKLEGVRSGSVIPDRGLGVM